MKYLFITTMAVAEALLITYFCITGWSIFLLSAIAFLILCLVAWYKDSAITYEWNEFTSHMRSSLNFQPKIFRGMQSYHFMCTKFPAFKPGIHKIVGLSKGLHHRDSIRMGYRIGVEEMYPVLYLYNRGKRIAINLGVSFKQDELMYVEWYIHDGVLRTKIENCKTEVFESIYYPVSFTFGWGYQLYPYGTNSKWLIRK